MYYKLYLLYTSPGYYMYIEASSPRNQGDTAILMSPLFTSPTQHLAVNFWYSMYGINIGSLQVYMDPPGDVHTLFTATKGKVYYLQTTIRLAQALPESNLG